MTAAALRAYLAAWSAATAAREACAAHPYGSDARAAAYGAYYRTLETRDVARDALVAAAERDGAELCELAEAAVAMHGATTAPGVLAKGGTWHRDYAAAQGRLERAVAKYAEAAHVPR